jgi:hypothetical protein
MTFDATQAAIVGEIFDLSVEEQKMATSRTL